MAPLFKTRPYFGVERKRKKEEGGNRLTQRVGRMMGKGKSKKEEGKKRKLVMAAHASLASCLLNSILFVAIKMARRRGATKEHVGGDL